MVVKVTPDEALEAARAAAAAADEARARLERAICEAAETNSLREVGRAVGLTHSRVHQIIHERTS